MTVDEVTTLELTMAVHESTPLREFMGGPGASVDDDGGAPEMDRKGHPWRDRDQKGNHNKHQGRAGRAPRYVLDDETRAALATWDGTAASLNRLVMQLRVPRNKLLDWLVEMGRAQRGKQGQRPKLITDAAENAEISATASTSAAADDDSEPEPDSDPEPESELEPEPEPMPRRVIIQHQQQPSAAQSATLPRIGLDEWLMSGADGVWMAGMLAVQPLPEEPNSFAVLIAHPDAPKVPGSVPAHLVGYLVKLLVRKSTITGVVYR